MRLSLAETPEERHEAQRLFEATVQDPSRVAVPGPEFDHVFRTLLVQARAEDGTLVGAAMTGEPYLTANLGLLPAHLRPANLVKVAGKVSELDLLAVLPAHRGQGIATRMLAFLEAVLVERGVRTWFGHGIGDVEISALGRLVARSGFTVVGSGETLPPFHGLQWQQPLTAAAPIGFWKRVGASAPMP